MLVALAVAALGLWWGFSSGGIVKVAGWLLVALAAALLWSALQRLRFAAVSEAPGVVEIVEGQIGYFGPAGGGFAALSEVAEILLAERGGARAWVLRTPGQGDLVIPLGATGAEQLFDAFGSLPGLTGGVLVAAVTPAVATGGATGAILPALRPGTPRLRRVWRRPPRALR